MFTTAATGAAPYMEAVAAAAVDESAPLTIEDVTPSLAPAGPLSQREAALVHVFETAAPAVASVFDVALMVSVSMNVPHAAAAQPWLFVAA